MTMLITGVLNRILRKVPTNNRPVLNVEEIQRKEYNSTREPLKHGAACFAPSVNMRFAADGSVTACCMNTENILGRYPEQSISEIWNSKLAVGFRQKMKEYKFLSGCQVCTRDYNKGDFDQINTRYFDTLPQLDAYPSMMEFLLNNTCNLECVMCTGDLSSSIRANRDKLPPITSPYDQKFVAQLQEFIPHLQETRFSGAGEAFAIKINYTFWEMLIAQNPSCRIVVQTNATILNARVKDFLNRGNFTIGISLDSLKKERYEAIRLNASFEQVMKNIDYLAEYSRLNNRPLLIAMCVMRNNVLEMPDFVHFCNRIGANICFHKVWTPLTLAVYNLPSETLCNIYTLLTEQPPLPSETPLQRSNKAHYEYYLSVIKGWMLDAGTQTANLEGIVNLSQNELVAYAIDRIRDYVMNETMLETDKEKLITLCSDKLNSVFSMWPDGEQKRAMLIRLCLIKQSEILIALKTLSVEKLYEMSLTTTEYYAS